MPADADRAVEHLADHQGLGGPLLEAAHVEQPGRVDLPAVDVGDPGHRHEDLPPPEHLGHHPEHARLAALRAERHHEVTHLADLVALGVEDRQPDEAGREDAGRGGAHVRDTLASESMPSDQLCLRHRRRVRRVAVRRQPAGRRPRRRPPRRRAAARGRAGVRLLRDHVPQRRSTPRRTPSGSSRPRMEIPFAGHPTLGTAWVLRDRGDLAGDDGDAALRCGRGGGAPRRRPGRADRDAARPRRAAAGAPGPRAARRPRPGPVRPGRRGVGGRRRARLRARAGHRGGAGAGPARHPPAGTYDGWPELRDRLDAVNLVALVPAAQSRPRRRARPGVRAGADRRRRGRRHRLRRGRARA